LTLRCVYELPTSQLIAATIGFAQPTSQGSMPSGMNRGKAFTAVGFWLDRANNNQTQASGAVDSLLSESTQEKPLALYVNIAIHYKQFKKANRELEKIDASSRNEWIRTNLGQDIMCKDLPVAQACCESSDFALAVQVAEALKHRAERGYQEGAESKASMRELIKQLVDLSWGMWEKEYREVGVDSKAKLVFPPATDGEIVVVENRTGVPLPDDYKELLKITNGYDVLLNFSPCLISTFQLLTPLLPYCFADSVLGNGILMEASLTLATSSERILATGRFESNVQHLTDRVFQQPLDQ
jgi:hypothetical protein